MFNKANSLDFLLIRLYLMYFILLWKLKNIYYVILIE